MKKEIGEHIILKNKSYSFTAEDGEKNEGVVTKIDFESCRQDEDLDAFNVLIELDNKEVKTFHSNDIVDIVERDLNPSV